MARNAIRLVAAALLLLPAGCVGKHAADPPPAVLMPSPTPIDVDMADRRPVDFGRRIRRPGFAAAIREVARTPGVLRVRLRGVPGAAGFRVAHDVAEAHLRGWNDYARARGSTAIRYQNNLGYSLARGDDAVLVLPTTNWDAVLRAVDTTGMNTPLSNAQIRAFLRDLARRHPFVVDEAGEDYVLGRFLDPPSSDAHAIAKQIYHLDPDNFDSVHDLETNIRLGELQLWWD